MAGVICSSGGGKRHGARGVVRRADFAARKLGSQAAKLDLDAKRQRCEDAKSVTEKDDLLRTSLLGRESSRSSATSYEY